MIHSAQPRPQPLHTDNDFARRTMAERVPGILREVQADNPDYAPPIRRALDRLHDDLVENKPIPMLDVHPVPPPDFADWEAAYRAHSSETGSLTWQNSEWFFAETFLYRHLIQTVRWHETGRDPYITKKLAEFEGEHFWTMLRMALDAGGSFEERLSTLLALALWANRADLSHPAGALAGEGAAEDELLVDDRASLLRHLGLNAAADLTLKDQCIHIVTDNAGSELGVDLVVADHLITVGGAVVVLQLKSYPIFVSDATIADVWQTLHTLESRGEEPRRLAQRLRGAWETGRLVLSAPPFWTSSIFLREMPRPLQDALRGAALVLVKGDANYRRITGDTVWHPAITFPAVVRDCPAPLAALRTIKSDPLVGVPLALTQKLDAASPGWRTTGRYGVIQFAAPAGVGSTHPR